MSSTTASAPTEVDVTVFGATGVTGRLVAQYLAVHPTRPRFALAGRNESKLAAVRAALPLPPETKADVPLIVADAVTDPASLEAMVARSRVVINVVGPFGQRNARAVVAECIRQKKHYADLTGESRYYADLVRDFGSAAEKAGSVIVPSAGFDSVPFDLATFLAAQRAQEASHRAGVLDVWCTCSIASGLGKGTLLSATDMVAPGLPGTVVPRSGIPTPVRKWELRLLYGDILSPTAPGAGEHPIPASLVMPAPGFGPQSIMSIFPFTPHNHRVVNRTWGLLQSLPKYAYGDRFQYHDGPLMPYRWAAALFSLVTLAIPWLMAFFPPIVWAIKALPDGWVSAGIGEEGFLDLRAVAVAETGEKAITYLNCRGDPGYLKTATMISEIALTTLEPADTRIVPAGILTSPLLGPTLPERLIKYGGFQINTELYDPTEAQKYKAF